MADITRNTKVRYFGNGGTIVIDDGTDDITIKNVRPDSVRITAPFVERISYNDGNSPKTPIPGDKTYGIIEFTSNAGAIQGAKELLTLARAEPTSGDTVLTYPSLTIRRPDRDGADTGEDITMENFWFENVPVYEGGKPDSLTGVQIRCLPEDWSAAPYDLTP